MLSITPLQDKADIQYLPTDAKHVYQYQKDISSKNKAKYTEDEHSVSNLIVVF